MSEKCECGFGYGENEYPDECDNCGEYFCPKCMKKHLKTCKPHIPKSGKVIFEFQSDDIEWLKGYLKELSEEEGFKIKECKRT